MNERITWVRGLCLAVALGAGTGWAAAARDVTRQMENLGLPLASRYPDKSYGGAGAYARNVWTLQAFDGRLYLGAGNSANGGPASNAGPVPVVAFDPKTGKFAEEGKVPDEQIDIFREFQDGALYIPGHDPKEDWKLGNFYRRAKGKGAAWEKVRTLPGGVHCYDMAEFDAKLLACGYGTYESSDRGRTFTHMKGPRYYAFLPFPKAIYAVGEASPERSFPFKSPKTGKLLQNRVPAHVALAKKAAGKAFEPLYGVKAEDVFPDTPEAKTRALKACRPSRLGEKVVYIGGIVHNDHQVWPLGVYVATEGEGAFKAVRVPLPAGAVPWFTFAAKGKVYLLWATAEGGGKNCRNHVSVTADGRVWTELFTFVSPTFARSMAPLEGFFYFGLGTEVAQHGAFEGNTLKLDFRADELSPASGTILRYRYPLK